MSKKFKDRKIEWIERNLPQVFALPPADVDHIVQQAIDLTNAVRRTLNVVGSVGGGVGGFFLARELLATPHSRYEQMAFVVAFTVAVTVVTAGLGDYILNRKIEFIGLGT